MRKQQDSIANFIQVLEYMDGPQAVLLERGIDSKIVGIAIEKQGYRYPFFGTEVSCDQWERYRRGFLDLRYLFMYPRWKSWYIFDLAREMDGKIQLERSDKDTFVEENYMPEHGFFSYDHSEPIQANEMAGLATLCYATDGKWDLPDFSNFYNKITDLYAFFLSLKKYTASDTRLDLKKKIRESFREPPLRGGFSYVNMYEGLLSIQGMGDRLSVGKLRYASAGEVDVRGRIEIFAEMAIALGEFTARYDDIKDRYNTLYKYCSKNKLLKADREGFEVSGPVAKFLLEQSKEFAAIMRLAEADLVYDLTGKNSLIFTKILLSHFRRLERYFMFFAEGRVREPKTILPPPVV